MSTILLAHEGQIDMLKAIHGGGEQTKPQAMEKATAKGLSGALQRLAGGGRRRGG